MREKNIGDTINLPATGTIVGELSAVDDVVDVMGLFGQPRLIALTVQVSAGE